MQYKLWGSTNDPKILNEYRKYIDRNVQACIDKKVPEEILKTEEDIRLLDCFIWCVRMAISSLVGYLPPEIDIGKQIKFVTGAWFDNHGQSPAAAGAAEYAVLYIAKERIHNWTHLFQVVAHEAIHLFSYRTYYINHAHGYYRDDRIGYACFDPCACSNSPYYTGFNEAMTDQLAMLIVENYHQVVTQYFNLKYNHSDMVFGYPWATSIMVKIVIQVDSCGLKERDAFCRLIFQGMFTGYRRHLRIIDKCFGPHSLYILSLLGTAMGDLGNNEMNKLINDYFSLATLEARRSLQQLLLPYTRPLILKSYESYDI